MVSFWAVVSGSRANTKKLVVENVNGFETFRLAEDNENLNDKMIVNAVQHKLWNDVNRILRSESILTATLSGGPTVLFSFIEFINMKGQRIELYNGQAIEFDDQDIIVCRELKNIFTHHPSYSISTESYPFILFFDLYLEISESSLVISHTDPSKIQLSIDIGEIEKHLIELKDPVRIILHPESFDQSLNWLPEGVKEKYNFQLVSAKNSNDKYWISEPIENFKDKFISDDFEFKNRVLSIAIPKEKNMPTVNYDFSKNFLGWDFIVFPFVNFIQGLSRVQGKLVTSKVVHLTQSTGYGKTRLCFEALKYFGRGIYCVYRSKDEGYPPTTPWFKQLIDDFKFSRSDEQSKNICRRFIENCVKYFNDYNDLNGTDNTLDIFESKNTDLPFYFDLSTTNHSSSVNNFKSEMKKNCFGNCFPLIIDECDELLITPNSAPECLNLYQILRGVLYEIKESSIVAVFLGTKSSIEDFVFKPARKRSNREPGDDIVNEFEVPLYVFTQSTDVMLNEPFVIDYAEITSTPQFFDGSPIIYSKVMEKFVVRCGRPLWSYYDSNFLEAYNIALDKLQTEQSLFELTCLIMRTGSSIVPHDELAHKLVLSGMATLLHVDIQGSRCWMEYPPEPILANVARNAILSANSYAKAISDYLKRLKRGAFHDSGSAGEFVGRIVLLRAMDLALLRPCKTSISSTNEKAIVVPQSALFGHDNENCKLAFNQKSILTSNSSPLSNNNIPNEPGSFVPNSYCSPRLGITTLREFLMMLTQEKSDDLYKFGVSDAVLDGLVSLNQFVQLDDPLVINQSYLLHGFTRCVGFILPPHAPGIDLVIPVLRSDNLMSCVVIQIKNYATDSFPCTPKNINNKLTIDYLKFISFAAIGEFKEAPWDDFVRIVIQFRENKKFEKKPKKLSIWKPIKNSTSMNGKNDNCWSLWILALDFFEKPLFFNNQGIIKDLNTILSAQRDFLNSVNFPYVKLPTSLQTSEVGVRFLVNSARTISNYQNIVIEDRSLRENEEKCYSEYCELMEGLGIPKTAKQFKENFKLVTKINTETDVKAEPEQRIIELKDSHQSDDELESREKDPEILSDSEAPCVKVESDYSVVFKCKVLAETMTENAGYNNKESTYMNTVRAHLENLNEKMAKTKSEFHSKCTKERNLAFPKIAIPEIPEVAIPEVAPPEVAIPEVTLPDSKKPKNKRPNEEDSAGTSRKIKPKRK